jgi:type I restriction enzyme R subunit
MPNFVSEDEIEAAMLQRLQLLHGYDVQDCFTADPADLNDGSGRTDKGEVILRDRLRAAVIDLNPDIPAPAIDDALQRLCDRRQALSAIAANREVDGLIRDGVRVEFKDAQGRLRQERVRIIDFNNPAANQFLAVSQLWILGERGYRRPDILIYINGLPLVFIELKNSNVKLKTAYDDNLTNYKAEIPQLFLTNALCVLSNAIETRVGSLTAAWEHFFHWLRPENEKEKIRREQIQAAGTSVERLLTGLFPKDRLLDYLESFIFYHKDTQKIIAQNHQFIGVNKSYDAFLAGRDSVASWVSSGTPRVRARASPSSSSFARSYESVSATIAFWSSRTGKTSTVRSTAIFSTPTPSARPTPPNPRTASNCAPFWPEQTPGFQPDPEVSLAQGPTLSAAFGAGRHHCHRR